ncbi:MAG: hypothetical protein OCD01_05525 [Fibrobacterales bacterium]
MSSKNDRFNRVPSNSGMSLVGVLATIALLSILISVIYTQRTYDAQFMLKNRSEIQSHLMLHSAQSFVKSRLRDRNIPIIKYTKWITSDSTGYSVDLEQEGLFLKSNIEGVTSAGTPNQSEEKLFKVGQLLDLQRTPVLVILDKHSNIKMAGQAWIDGPVALWRGRAKAATHSRMRYRGSRPINVHSLDSTHTIWNNIGHDFSEIDQWFNKKVSQRWESTGLSSYTNTTIDNQTLHTNGRITIGEGSIIKNSRVYGGEVVIQDGAIIENSLIFSKSSLSITGDVTLDGQFLAQDSLYLKTGKQNDHTAHFYVHGRSEGEGYNKKVHGSLIVDEYNGNGTFISRGYKSEKANDVQVKVSNISYINGLIYTTGYVDIRGIVSGSVICQNLKFLKDGTNWVGFLLDGQLSLGQEEIRIPRFLDKNTRYFFQEQYYDAKE